jgi:hypothetical protein
VSYTPLSAAVPYWRSFREDAEMNAVNVDDNGGLGRILSRPATG